MKKSILIFILLLLFAIGIVFSITVSEEPMNASNSQSNNADLIKPDQPVIYYIKVFNATLLGLTPSDEVVTCKAPVTSGTTQPCQQAQQADFPIIKNLLPAQQATEYIPINILRESKVVPISIPVFSEEDVPPFYCSRFVKYVSQQLYGECFPSDNAWNMRYKTNLNVYTIKPTESLNDLVNNGTLKEGMALGVYNPNSEYNNTIDSQGNKALYTHVVIFVGQSEKGSLLFSDLYSNQIRILSEANLLAEVTPKEVLSIKQIVGVNRTCNLDPSKVITREEYYNNLVEFIRYEESERKNGSGARKLASKIWEEIGGAKSYGPYQINLFLTRNLIEEGSLTHVFGSKKSSDLSDNQIIEVLNDPIRGKQVSLILTESNEKVIINYTAKSGYLCKIPEFGSQDRYALEGASYNSGIMIPMTAGFEYSLTKAGVDYNGIEEIARFDGKLGEGSKTAITKWVGSEIALDFGTLNTTSKTYPSAMSKLLSNPEFMKKFFDAYKAKNPEETCIPLFIPFKDIANVKTAASINYGSRVANQSEQ
jgi:hypothetical protein